MIWGVMLILLSLIAVPSLILSKKPNAIELLAKVEPYQGWIGLFFCSGGIWGIISAVLNISMLSTAPIWWATLLAGNIVSATLGFMLGSGVINKLFLATNDVAKARAEEFRAKIAPKQGKLGILGLVVGIWVITASFLYNIA